MTGYFLLADGRTLPLRDGFLLGRATGCDVVLDDSKASRRHAKVVLEAGVAEIEDLGSSNGTLLNGKPVQRRLLRDGDAVQIGSTVLTYREGAPPAAAAANSAAAAQPAALFEDDDELFGGESTSLAPPVASPAASSPPVPPAAPPPAATSPALPRPAPVPPPPPPPASPPKPAVVEFADEVVELRQSKPPAAAAARAAAPAAPLVQQTGQRVLQFSQQTAKGGMLGDDVGQLSGGMRALVFGGVLLVALGLGWLCIWLMRS